MNNEFLPVHVNYDGQLVDLPQPVRYDLDDAAILNIVREALPQVNVIGFVVVRTEVTAATPRILVRPSTALGKE